MASCQYQPGKTRKGVSEILKVKHFICGASYASLEYFDEDMNKWILKNNIRKIQNIHEFYGQAPVGMSGHQENVIFVSLWYEDEAATKPEEVDVEVSQETAGS